MGKLQITPGEIISFWLDAGKDKWFGQDEQFDALIRENFLTLWRVALSGRLKHWLESDEGLLALTIILDQFPRYMFRGDPRAYCSDNDARKIAQLALEKRTDQRIAPELRGFLYMPFEHSEKIADQEKSIELFTALKMKPCCRVPKFIATSSGNSVAFLNATKLLAARPALTNRFFLIKIIIITGISSFRPKRKRLPIRK
ncbi:Uncharacterized conserved protein, DUF924 family [Bartonella apihabitans]|uniref:Uncharacterized conserved protein, DUF924 family n=1 Tax=Bartonella apihabitans TaxID=2750929 RepID=A0A1U9MCK0_9HYPH|nr:Uncharacterized conserved protein, DUF924 family [Bartonella apihabitans]